MRIYICIYTYTYYIYIYICKYTYEYLSIKAYERPLQFLQLTCSLLAELLSFCAHRGPKRGGAASN